MEEKREEYEKPQVESEEIYERTALACDRDAFPNSRVDLKDNSSSCGYNDS